MVTSVPQRRDGSRISQLLLILLIGVIAVFLGLIATTASPLLVALAAGSIGGVFLLANPRLIVWVVLVAGLAGGALVSLAGAQFSKLPWGVVILSFLLWAPLAFSLIRGVRKPAFILLLFAFLLLAIVFSVLRMHSFGEFIAGFKRYFQAYGLLLALALIPFTARDVRQWRLALAGIALLQLPFALYERFVLVPLRGGLESGRAETTDIVAGTFGANMEGGSPNSLMVAFLLFAMAFAYMRWREGLLPGWKTILFVIPCFIPLFLGETKIILVLIPLILLVLHRKEAFRRPFEFMFVVLLAAGMVTLFAFVYAEMMWHRPLSAVVEETVAYNFLHKGHGHSFLNRTTALLFWWEKQSLADPVGFLFGHGIGSAYTGVLSFSVGHLAATYMGYGIDLTAISILLWEVGLVGLVLHLAIFVSAWFAAARLARTARDPAVRADAMSIQAAVAVFLLFHYYTNSIVSLLSGELIVAVILGYLGYLMRTAEAAK
ncbi:MAG: hypothetical protein L6Q52_07510 [Rhodocyclaceae bacterium]|nr:hypothetical protein [Rhodocyclaceae bacterium]